MGRSMKSILAATTAAALGLLEHVEQLPTLSKDTPRKARKDRSAIKASRKQRAKK